MIKSSAARMLCFFIIIVSEETRFALFPLRVKDGNDYCHGLSDRTCYPSSVEMIAVVIERGSRISQRPASTRPMKSPQI